MSVTFTKGNWIGWLVGVIVVCAAIAIPFGIIFSKSDEKISYTRIDPVNRKVDIDIKAAADEIIAEHLERISKITTDETNPERGYCTFQKAHADRPMAIIKGDRLDANKCKEKYALTWINELTPSISPTTNRNHIANRDATTGKVTKYQTKEIYCLKYDDESTKIDGKQLIYAGFDSTDHGSFIATKPLVNDQLETCMDKDNFKYGKPNVGDVHFDITPHFKELGWTKNYFNEPSTQQKAKLLNTISESGISKFVVSAPIPSYKDWVFDLDSDSSPTEGCIRFKFNNPKASEMITSVPTTKVAHCLKSGYDYLGNSEISLKQEISSSSGLNGDRFKILFGSQEYSKDKGYKMDITNKIKLAAIINHRRTKLMDTNVMDLDEVETEWKKHLHSLVPSTNVSAGGQFTVQDTLSYLIGYELKQKTTSTTNPYDKISPILHINIKNNFQKLIESLEDLNVKTSAYFESTKKLTHIDTLNAQAPFFKERFSTIFEKDTGYEMSIISTNLNDATVNLPTDGSVAIAQEAIRIKGFLKWLIEPTKTPKFLQKS